MSHNRLCRIIVFS